MTSNLAVSVSIGAALAGSFQQVLGGAGKQLNRLGRAVQQVDKQSKALIGFKENERDLSQAAQAFENAKNRVAALRDEMRGVEQPTAKMRQAIERARIEAEKARQAFEQKKQTLSTSRAELKRLGLSYRDIEGQQRRLGTSTESLRKRQEALQSAMAKSQAIKNHRADLRGQALDAIALGAALAAPVKAAVEFESVMADVRKVVNFDTPEQFNQMGRDIRRLSTELPISAAGIGQIIAAAGQSGVARDQLAGFAQDAARMSVAFDISAEQAGESMANWRAGMGLSQERVVALADSVNHLSNSMNAKAKDITEVITRIGPFAQAAGLAEKQTAGLSAALLSAGAAPEVISTAMGKLLGVLGRGEAATKTQSDAFAQLGMDVHQLASDMQHDAQGTIVSVFKALEQAAPEERNSLLMQIFGEEGVRAISPLMSQLGNLEKAFATATDEARSSGSMMREFQQRAATTENNLQLLRNKVNNLGISLGTVLLPGVNAVANGLGWAAGHMASFAEQFPTATKWVVGLTAGLIVGKVAILGAAYALTFISGAIYSIIGAGQVVASTFTLLKAGLIGTSTASLFASKALVVTRGALAAATKGTLWLTAATWSATKSLFGLAGGALKSASAGVVRLGAATLAASKTLLVFAGGALKAVALGIWAIGKALLMNPIGLIVGAIAGAAYLIYKYWEPIKSFFGDLWNGVLSTFNTAKDWLMNIDWGDVGRSIIGTLVDGILSVGLAPFNAVKSVLSNVRELLPFSDAKTGPLSDLTASGAAIPQTLAEGAQAGSSGLFDGLLSPASGSGSTGATTVTNHYSVTVHAAPGMNAEDLARAVEQQLTAREAAQARRQRGRLYDGVS